MLTGGAGADLFILDSSLGVSNIDVFKDFVSGTDKILLDDDVFTKFLGTLSDAALSADNLATPTPIGLVSSLRIGSLSNAP